MDSTVSVGFYCRSNNRKNDRIIFDHAPMHIWQAAEKQAMRSSLVRFKTGAVIFRGSEIVSKGCSYVGAASAPRKAIHAEQHALRGISGHEDNLSCLIVTLNRSNNWAGSSKPCAFCVHLMHKAGIDNVIYAERDNSSEWSINKESIDSLINRSMNINARYAKEMRI
jgi:deoxycytidylate deaminase